MTYKIIKNKKIIKLTALLLLLIMFTAIIVSFNYFKNGNNRETAGVIKKADTIEREFISNEIYIKVKSDTNKKIKITTADNTGIPSINNLNKKYNAKEFKKATKETKVSKKDDDIFTWYKIVLDGKKEKVKGEFDKKTKKLKTKSLQSLQDAIDEFRKDPNVEAVELNYKLNQFLTPNDTYFSTSGSFGNAYPDMWGLKKINSELAWDESTGSATVNVAVIDTGVDINHPDIVDNIWVNPGESGATVSEGTAPNCTSRSLALDKKCNNIDDDDNGYIDDYNGYNFALDNNDVTDLLGHGTHIAGVIGASGNNGIGVAGVNWQTKIVPLRIADEYGDSYVFAAMDALVYASDMGFKVSNNSWGLEYQDSSLNDFIDYVYESGMIIVVAAGNDNEDAINYWPANSEKVITVAATDKDDLKAPFSNYGQNIDVTAPGVNILSTNSQDGLLCPEYGIPVGDRYCVMSGTSMAAPHVVGLAALILSKYPTLTNEQVRQLIRANSFDLGTAGFDPNFGYGRIDAFNSIIQASTPPLNVYITSPHNFAEVTGNSVQIIGSVSGVNFSEYKVEIGAGENPTEWTTLTTSTNPVVNNVLTTLDTTQYSDGLYSIKLTATDTNTKTYSYQLFDILINNIDAYIDYPFYEIPKGLTDITGTVDVKNGLVLSNYSIEFNVGESESWSSEGITLRNNGQNSVIDWLLGTIDTTNFDPWQVYRLRLTVNTTTGKKDQYVSDPFYVEFDEIVVPTPTPLPTPTPQPLLPGDLDSNTKVNVFDLSMLLRGWGKPGSTDLNGDNNTNVFDLSILLRNWSQ